MRVVAARVTCDFFLGCHFRACPPKNSDRISSFFKPWSTFYAVPWGRLSTHLLGDFLGGLASWGGREIGIQMTTMGEMTEKVSGESADEDEGTR